MKVLGIESATAVCAAALVCDGRVLREALLEMKHAHAERLLGQIEEVLGRRGPPRDGLEGVAVSIGPGSFTGLRIGLSVAKGLAYARGIPLVGVPTLEALALHAASVDKPPGRLLVALDARRDEVYCQLFALITGGVEAVWNAEALTVAALLEKLGDAPALVAGDAADKVLRAAGEAGALSAASPEARRCSASSVALLGERLLRAGMADDASALEPRYIREFFLKSR